VDKGNGKNLTLVRRPKGNRKKKGRKKKVAYILTKKMALKSITLTGVGSKSDHT